MWQVCGRPLAYENLDGVRDRMAQVSPTLVMEGVHDCPLTGLALDQAAASKVEPLTCPTHAPHGSAILQPELAHPCARPPATLPCLDPWWQDTMTPGPFARAVDNFYMTNAINRSSVTMAKCTAAKQPSYAFVGAGSNLALMSISSHREPKQKPESKPSPNESRPNPKPMLVNQLQFANPSQV